MVGELLRATRSFFSRKPRDSGDSLIIEGVGMGKGTVTVKLLCQAGIISRPPKGTRIIAIPVGVGRSVMYGIAAHNYKINFMIAEGATTIFSTNTDGSQIKARIDLDADGKIKLSNATKSLHSVLRAIVLHVKSATTVDGKALNPATISQLEADEAAISALLKD